MNMALDNSNTCIGYKLAFYRYMYNIDMYSDINSSIKLLSASDEQVAIVNSLSRHTFNLVISVKSGSRS